MCVCARDVIVTVIASLCHPIQPPPLFFFLVYSAQPQVRVLKVFREPPFYRLTGCFLALCAGRANLGAVWNISALCVVPNRKDFRGQICRFPLPVTSLPSSLLLSRLLLLLLLPAFCFNCICTVSACLHNDCYLHHVFVKAEKKERERT